VAADLACSHVLLVLYAGQTDKNGAVLSRSAVYRSYQAIVSAFQYTDSVVARKAFSALAVEETCASEYTVRYDCSCLFRTAGSLQWIIQAKVFTLAEKIAEMQREHFRRLKSVKRCMADVAGFVNHVDRARKTLENRCVEWFKGCLYGNVLNREEFGALF
jgi:hypothetical protein